MSFESAGATHVGRRNNNEDAYCLAPQLGLFAVADGMGGYEGGEVAAALTVKTLVRYVERSRRGDNGLGASPEGLLTGAARLAHREIQQRKTGRLTGMGSTMAAVLFSETRVTVAHVGDSRVYLLRRGELYPLTVDHSLEAEFAAAGVPMPPGAKHQITRALGVEGNAEPTVRTQEIEPGDTFLLCSDGLHDAVSPERIRTVLRGSDARNAAQQLVREAISLGTKDNVTVVVTRVASALAAQRGPPLAERAI